MGFALVLTRAKLARPVEERDKWDVVAFPIDQGP